MIDRRANGFEAFEVNVGRAVFKTFQYLNMTDAARKMVELRWRKQSLLSEQSQDIQIGEWKAGYTDLLLEV